MLSLWLAWRIVILATAHSLTASDPQRALGWLSSYSPALDRAAERELLTPSGNFVEAEKLAQRSLGTNPSDERAIVLMGLIAEKRGELEHATELMQIAGKRSWRDPVAQEWLFNAAIRRQEYGEALEHLDALLRFDEGSKEKFLLVLASFTTLPKALDRLVDLLATNPPWRTWLTAGLAQRLRDRGSLLKLFSELERTSAPPDKDELRAFLNRLIKDQQYELAYEVWQRNLSPPERERGTYLYNGNFALPVDNIPFNWQFEPVPGGSIEVVPLKDNKSYMALRLQFSGGRIAFTNNVRKLLMLPPGTWRLSGEVRAADLQTTRGIWWHLFCAANPSTDLGATELISGTFGWQEFSKTFMVPPGCQAQSLQLEQPARVGSETAIRGEVLYRNIQLSAVPGQ